MAASSVFKSGLFNNKVAIVTGGGTGIGKALSAELLELGCNVVISSRKVERLEAAAEELKQKIPASSLASVVPIACNIRHEDEVKALVSSVLKKYGQIDFLVNNGGGQFSSPVESMSSKGWKAVIDTNLTGTFHCCKEVYSAWMKDHGGVIVNIIADMWKGFPGMAHTGAARAAVDNLTKSLAIEWASSGVRINAIAPGTIISKTAMENYKEFGPTLFKMSVPFSPAKRLGVPEEISPAVCFLLSPAASYISGATFRVDAGQSLYHSMWDIPDHSAWPEAPEGENLDTLKELLNPKSKLCWGAVNEKRVSQWRLKHRGHNNDSARMGGDHGHSKLNMPDWRQWKADGTPLEFTQQRLAARGLKDPWARNEAWRYMGGFAQPVTFGNVLLRGFKWGFAAFAVALAVEYALFPPKKSDH